MEVLAIWIIITELPNIKMIVTLQRGYKYSQPLCNYGSVNSKLAYRIAGGYWGGGGYSSNIHLLTRGKWPVLLLKNTLGLAFH